MFITIFSYKQNSHKKQDVFLKTYVKFLHLSLKLLSVFLTQEFPKKSEKLFSDFFQTSLIEI